MSARTRAACVTAIVLACGVGCSTVVEYDLTDLPTARSDSRRQAMRVAMTQFQDMRPEEERNLPPENDFWRQVTWDRMFEGGNVAHGIGEAIVKHFNHVQLFKAVEMIDVSAAHPSPEVLDKVKSLGYDALFTGTIKHFHGVGHPTTFDAIGLGLSLVPITGVVTIPIMLMEDNENEGFVEIADVQLTDAKSGRVLWSGTFQKRKAIKYVDAYPARAASETLREIADEIVKQIEATTI